MLQLAADLPTNPSNGKHVPVEIKVECVWGRAFVSEVVVQEDFDVPWDRITVLRPPPGRPNSEAQFCAPLLPLEDFIILRRLPLTVSSRLDPPFAEPLHSPPSCRTAQRRLCPQLGYQY